MRHSFNLLLAGSTWITFHVDPDSFCIELIQQTLAGNMLLLPLHWHVDDMLASLCNVMYNGVEFAVIICFVVLTIAIFTPSPYEVELLLCFPAFKEIESHVI